MSIMGRLEEIKEEYAKSEGYNGWDDLIFEESIGCSKIMTAQKIENHLNNCYNKYTKECVIASLEKASYPSDEYGNPKSLLYENGDFHVPQSLITSQENIILL